MKDWMIKEQEDNNRLAKELAEAPKLRDVNECRKCEFFRMDKETGHCGCGNVPKYYGHPWSLDSPYYVTDVLFEKVRIRLADSERCKFPHKE